MIYLFNLYASAIVGHAPLHKVVRLTYLKTIYINELAKTEFSNPNFRADKLKRRFEYDVDSGFLMS